MITISEAYKAPSLFSGLSDMLNSHHPLYSLADKIDWKLFEDAFSPLYCKDNESGAKPIRLITGLLILKHVRSLSDDSEVEQCQENPYYQYFCGMTEFSTKAPCNPTELVHFRHRIGEQSIDLILKESIRVTHNKWRGRKPNKRVRPS